MGPGRAHMGPYGSIWALMGPRCAHVGPFGPKGFCFNHLRLFVKRRGSYWQPVRTLCGYLVFFLTLEVIIHPKWQKSETNFKNCQDFVIVSSFRWCVSQWCLCKNIQHFEKMENKFVGTCRFARYARPCEVSIVALCYHIFKDFAKAFTLVRRL